MSLTTLRESRATKAVAMTALISFIATFFHARPASADAPAGFGPVSGGAAGLAPQSGTGATSASAELGSVDATMGTALTHYSFNLPKARGDAQPSLGLSYNSQNGVGVGGMGWSLTVPSITRRGHGGLPRFVDNQPDPGTDDYYIDGKLLIPINPSTVTIPASIAPLNPGSSSGDLHSVSPVSVYRTEVDDGARYFLPSAMAGKTWFQQTKSGHMLQYGEPYLDTSGALSLENTDGITTGTFTQGVNDNSTYRWNLMRDTDAIGNTVYYFWDLHRDFFAANATTNQGVYYLTDVYDTSSAPPNPDPSAEPPALSTFAHHVHLGYVPAQYPNTLPLSTFPPAYRNSPIWTAPPSALLSTVDVTSASWTSTTRQLVRRYSLNYNYNATQTRPYLVQVGQTGDCLLHGGAIPEDPSSGQIPTDSNTAFKMGVCAGAEAMPPTTYTYTGITSPGSFVPPSTFPAPQIIAETPAFTSPLAPDFLADLDGDGVDELIAGENGDALAPCLSCTIDRGGGLLDTFTFFLYGALGGKIFDCKQTSQTCQQPGAIKGPTQTNGATFALSRANGLVTMKADDAMFGYTIAGPWAPSGRTNFLQAWPNPIVLAPGTYFTTPSIVALSLNDFAGTFSTDGSAVFRNLAGQTSMSTADTTVLVGALGLPNTQPPVPGLATQEFMAQHAVDVDGDGLPDMVDVPVQVNGGPPSYTTFFSSRDRNGETHPFQNIGQTLCAAPAQDPSHFATPALSNTRTLYADMDGDGAVDLVYANKFGANMSTSGTLNRLGFYVLPGRGDGRFGLHNSSDSVASCYIDNDRAVTPTPWTDPGDTVGAGTMQQSVVRLGDLNSDGYADYAALDSAGLHICLRYGASWDNATYKCVTEPSLKGDDQSDATKPHATIMIGDVDGSGVNQVIYFPAPSAPFGAPLGNATAVRVSPQSSSPLGTGQGPRDGLLQSISNGIGAQMTFSYASIKQLKPEDIDLNGVVPIPVPLWLVTQTSTSNGLSGPDAVNITRRYSYLGPEYDNRERQFVGFQKVQIATSGDPSGNANGNVQKLWFATDVCTPITQGTTVRLDDDCDDPHDGFYSVYHMMRGLPVAIETDELLPNGSAGNPITTTINSYMFQVPYTGTDGRTGISIQTETSQTYVWGGTTATSTWLSTLGRTVGDQPPYGSFQVTVPAGVNPLTTITTYDPNGNLLSVVENGGTSASPSDRPIVTSSTWNLPPGDTTGWNYRITKQTVGYQSDPTPTREFDYSYDSVGRVMKIVRNIHGTYALPGVGGAARVANPPGQSIEGDDAPIYITYDPTYGNVQALVTSQTDCLASYTYQEPYYELLATSSSSPTGNCTELLTTSYVYDRGLQQVTSTVDPQERFSTMTYDDFGRINEIDKPSLGGPLAAITSLIVDGYLNENTFQVVSYRTGTGPEGTAGATTPSQYVQHYTYLDSMGDTIAQIDAVDPATHQNNSWLLSGVHAKYSNNRLRETFQPMYLSGAINSGAVPGQALLPTSPGSTLVYDAQGRVVNQTDYNGNTTKTVYHGISSVDSYDQEQTAALNGQAPVFGGTVHNGHTTTLYDGHGRPFESDVHLTVGPDGTANVLTTTAQYLATGEPTQIQQVVPHGPTVTRTMTYDSRGRLVRSTEPNSGTSTYAYDNMDQLVGTADARGCGFNLARDLGERAVYKDYIPCATAAGASQQALYTAPQGNGDGTEEFYVYNSLGQLTDTYDLARHDSYAFYPNGAIKTVTSQLATPTGSSSLASRYTALDPTTSLSETVTNYTIAGQPVSTVLTNGPSAFPSFDSVTETATYGLDDSLTSTSAAFADWSGPIIASVNRAANGTVVSVGYGDVAHTSSQPVWDNAGELTLHHLTRNGGAFTNGAFTNTVSPMPPDVWTTQADLMSTVITRDRVENPTTTRDMSLGAWPPGYRQVAQTFSYFDDYRLQSMTANVPADNWYSPYQYDPPGVYPATNSPSTGTRARLQSYQYDWRGNVKSSVDDANDFPDRSLGTVVAAAGATGPDQVGQVAPANGQSAQATYDATGNLIWFNPKWANQTTMEGYTYYWDELGRLQRAQRTDSDGVIRADERYTYDRNGARGLMSRLDPTTGTTTYSAKVFDSFVLENARFESASAGYQDDATTANFYLSGGTVHMLSRPGMPVSTRTNAAATGVHWFLNLPDALGSTAFVIDYQTGEVVERPSYLVYGQADTDYRPGRWKNFREDGRLGGHWDHAEVGLVHMGARYYAPQLGRFISPDPLVVHGQGISNPYEYAYGSPTHFSDPSGLVPESDGYAQMTDEQLAATWDDEDWSPDPPGTVAETASDAPGGQESDFDQGGQLNDFDGFANDREAKADQQFVEGVVIGINNDVLQQIDTAITIGLWQSMGPQLALDYRAANPLSTLHISPPSNGGGQIGNYAGHAIAIGAGFLVGTGEEEVVAEGASALEGVALRAESALQGSLLRQQLAAEEIAGARLPSGISGYTIHGLDQAISREGVGVSVRSILDTMRNPLRIAGQSGGRFVLEGASSQVVLNAGGDVITVVPFGSAAFRISF